METNFIWKERKEADNYQTNKDEFRLLPLKNHNEQLTSQWTTTIHNRFSFNTLFVRCPYKGVVSHTK